MPKKYREEIKIRAVNSYLRGKRSLEEVAKEFNLHRDTLWRWVKLYKNGGEESLAPKRQGGKTWNRTPPEIEFQVVLLKEKSPGITVTEIQGKMRERKIYLSRNAIFNILKRYNLAGWQKTEDIVSTLERDIEPQGAPKGPLKKTFEEYIQLRRDLKRFFTHIERVKYFNRKKKFRKLRQNMEKEGFFLSASLCGIVEILACEWSLSGELRKLVNHLEKLLSGGKKILNFSLAYSKGLAFVWDFDYQRGLSQARKLERILRSRKYLNVSFNYLHVGALYTHVNDYRNADFYYEKGLQVCKDPNEGLMSSLLIGRATSLSALGKYKETLAVLDQIETEDPKMRGAISMIKTQIFLLQGKFSESMEMAKTALDLTRREEFIPVLNASDFIFASTFAALNNIEKAKSHIKSMIPMLENVNYREEAAVRKIVSRENYTIDRRILMFPKVKVPYLLRKAAETGRLDFFDRAYKLAKEKGLLAPFYTFLLFFPDLVMKVIRKRGPRVIPRNLLEFPVFRKNAISFYLSFLGPLRIFSDDKRVKARLTQKEGTFLIHLSLSKEDEIPVEDLYQNFWPSSSDPGHSLSQLLWKLRKKLSIPASSLRIRRFRNRTVLVKSDITFTTDYQKFEHLLSRARAAHRVGEWEIARVDYLRTFSLVRGSPFKRMYDKWSEDKRIHLIFLLEEEVKKFVDSCLLYGNNKDAVQVLRHFREIIPELDLSSLLKQAGVKV